MYSFDNATVSDPDINAASAHIQKPTNIFHNHPNMLFFDPFEILELIVLVFEIVDLRIQFKDNTIIIDLISPAFFPDLILVAVLIII